MNIHISKIALTTAIVFAVVPFYANAQNASVNTEIASSVQAQVPHATSATTSLSDTTLKQPSGSATSTKQRRNASTSVPEISTTTPETLSRQLKNIRGFLHRYHNADDIKSEEIYSLLDRQIATTDEFAKRVEKLKQRQSNSWFGAFTGWRVKILEQIISTRLSHFQNRLSHFHQKEQITLSAKKSLNAKAESAKNMIEAQ